MLWNVLRRTVAPVRDGLLNMAETFTKNDMEERVVAAVGRPKLVGRAFYESIGSPKWVVAPMVDRSEFVGSFLPLNLAGSG